MGQMDAKHVFSDEQTVALNAGANANSTNVWSAATGKAEFDSTTAKYADFSTLAEMRILVTVEGEALAAAVDGAVLTIAVYEHTAATSIDSGNVILTKDITVNTAATGATAIGTVLADFILPQGEIDEKYLGLDYSVATQNISTGKVTARATDHRAKLT
jgi:hypothetical protein